MTYQTIGPPIFVAGCVHSGTTLVRRLLGSHSRIYEVMFETWMFVDRADPRFDRHAERLVLDSWPSVAHVPRGYLTSGLSEYAAAVAAYADAETMRAGKSRWVEKTPLHVACLATLLNAVPSANVVLILRDGRDVAVSLRTRYEQPDALQAGAERWVVDNAAGEKYWADPRVTVIRLEDLINNPEAVVRGVCAAIGEPYESQMTATGTDTAPDLEHCPAPGGASWRRYRHWLHRQPIFDTRGAWRSAMTRDEREWFKEIAGDALIRYGYADNLNW